MIFVKLKSITMLLTKLSFIIGIAGFIMIFMKLEIPTVMIRIAIILLFIVSMSEFISTRKLRKAVYPLIMIYFFVGMPFLESFIDNRVLSNGAAILGCVITVIFICNDLMITNKEKELSQ
ncbi:hypothetical protein [Clostridium estertheticum]|uniref:Uncharacterized protein n=1 Tax=Clostridium estertheticum TaxID=238834 RepID=A0AA47I9G1_9CLOT|nr:hypothetical protein [Clostridium estertheticum]MBU3155568.1 hypothetical protein [Clostridium estertheticum]WAG63170.1 hypothetical protein LL038_21245 [Clostridium estertheticum]